MNCFSCINMRQAAHRQMIGCYYWTSIVHGDINMLKSALVHISRLENFPFNPDDPGINRKVVAFLIDILIDQYAPKPLYEGWARLSIPCIKDETDKGMTEGCVVLNPGSCCTFSQYNLYEAAIV